EEALGDEEREVGVDVAGLLDAAVQVGLDRLPYGVAVGADDHAALHGAVVGHLGLQDHVEIPLREVLAAGRDLLQGALFLHDQRPSSGARGNNSDRMIDEAITPTMMASEGRIGKCPPNARFSHTIFSPTNTSTTPRPYFRRWNLSTAPLSRK